MGWPSVSDRQGGQAVFRRVIVAQCVMAVAFVLHHPAAQKIGVQAVPQCHGSNRYAGMLASRNDFRFECRVKGAAAAAT